MESENALMGLASSFGMENRLSSTSSSENEIEASLNCILLTFIDRLPIQSGFPGCVCCYTSGALGRCHSSMRICSRCKILCKPLLARLLGFMDRRWVWWMNVLGTSGGCGKFEGLQLKWNGNLVMTRHCYFSIFSLQNFIPLPILFQSSRGCLGMIT